MNDTDMHRPGEQKAYSPAHGGQLRYLLYLPPGFNVQPERRWPVLCFLHGRGEAARNVEGVDQPIETLFSYGAPPWHCAIDSPQLRDFIVLSPQRPAQGPWEERDLDEITGLIDSLYLDFRGDRDRTYLTGFSLGGKAVFDFVVWGQSDSRRPRWAALLPVDDANDQPRISCDTARIWLHFGTWKPDPQNATVTNLSLRKVELYRQSESSTDRQYSDYAGAGCGHCPTCVAAYADPRVYQWLLRSRAVAGPMSAGA